MPAAAETGLALKVPGCWIFSWPAAAVRAKSSRSSTSARPATAPPGRPPARILASVVRSGVMPNCAWAPPGATRKPVITSSRISSTPCAAVSSRRLARKPARQRRHAERAAGRLDQRGRDVAVGGERGAQRVGVARLEQQRVGGDLGEHARRRRAVEMARVARGHVVVPAVEVRLEADDLAPAGERAGEPHRHQRRLGAGRGEAHALGARHQPLDGLGPAHLERVVGAEVGAARERLLHRGGDLADGCGRAAARRGRRSSRCSGCHRRPTCTAPGRARRRCRRAARWRPSWVTPLGNSSRAFSASRAEPGVRSR